MTRHGALRATTGLLVFAVAGFLAVGALVGPLSNTAAVGAGALAGLFAALAWDLWLRARLHEAPEPGSLGEPYGPRARVVQILVVALVFTLLGLLGGVIVGVSFLPDAWIGAAVALGALSGAVWGMRWQRRRLLVRMTPLQARREALLRAAVPGIVAYVALLNLLRVGVRDWLGVQPPVWLLTLLLALLALPPLMLWRRLRERGDAPPAERAPTGENP